MSLSADDDCRPCVMVTGAGGFIGGRVVRELARSGAEVVAVVRRCWGDDHPSMLASSHRITTVECDLLDPAAVSFLIDAQQPEACIHCAWDVAGADYLHDTANQRWVQASLHLARCVMQRGCRWMGVCGTHIEPHRKAPAPNRYAAAKTTLRHRLFELAGARMTVCWWRIFQPYGEGERSHRFLPSMLETLAAGERFLVRQPEARRDFIHADDIARAIVMSQQNEIGGVFELGGGRLHRLRDVARLAARMLRSEHLLDFAPVAPAPDERLAPADIGPLDGLAQWQPQIDLEDGLNELARQWTTPLRASA